MREGRAHNPKGIGLDSIIPEILWWSKEKNTLFCAFHWFLPPVEKALF
jgi:hypothetical protein